MRRRYRGRTRRRIYASGWPQYQSSNWQYQVQVGARNERFQSAIGPTAGSISSTLSGFVVNKNRCAGCGLCLPECEPGAISLVSGKASIDQDFCIKCGNCARVCPEGAIVVKSSPDSHKYLSKGNPA